MTSGTLTEKCIEMNKRIKQLVKQAKDHADYYAMLSDGIEQEIFTEKFAELIVRECMLICEDVMKKDNSALGCWSEIKRTFRS